MTEPDLRLLREANARLADKVKRLELANGALQRKTDRQRNEIARLTQGLEKAADELTELRKIAVG